MDKASSSICITDDLVAGAGALWEKDWASIMALYTGHDTRKAYNIGTIDSKLGSPSQVYERDRWWIDAGEYHGIEALPPLTKSSVIINHLLCQAGAPSIIKGSDKMQDISRLSEEGLCAYSKLAWSIDETLFDATKSGGIRHCTIEFNNKDTVGSVAEALSSAVSRSKSVIIMTGNMEEYPFIEYLVNDRKFPRLDAPVIADGLGFPEVYIDSLRLLDGIDESRSSGISEIYDYFIRRSHAVALGKEDRYVVDICRDGGMDHNSIVLSVLLESQGLLEGVAVPRKKSLNTFYRAKGISLYDRSEISGLSLRDLPKAI